MTPKKDPILPHFTPLWPKPKTAPQQKTLESKRIQGFENGAGDEIRNLRGIFVE
jgi:hypothetical protein